MEVRLLAALDSNMRAQTLSRLVLAAAPRARDGAASNLRVATSALALRRARGLRV